MLVNPQDETVDIAVAGGSVARHTFVDAEHGHGHILSGSETLGPDEALTLAPHGVSVLTLP